MDAPTLQRLAPPGVTVLVCFLAYTSQWLFHHIEPGPLESGDTRVFNGLVACLLICYWRTCLTDPGKIPADWQERLPASQQVAASPSASPSARAGELSSNRWCRKCNASKPPRAHHCKTCKRCIMKMDHHCVWTANCVSHITIPHFVRFLFYAVLSMFHLEYYLYVRGAVIWERRHWPSYLGPSVLQLAHLFVLAATNSLVLFALTLLLGRTLWSLAVNTWTIESWEIERHHTLLRRARVLGGYLEGPDGTRVRIQHQEFPWDVGIWTNICQGMGSVIPVMWLWPLAPSPSVQSGTAFAHNEIEDPSRPWPPPDPDRLFRAARAPLHGDGFVQSLAIDDFRRRQAEDLKRYADADGDYVVRRRPFHERLDGATDRRPGDDPDESAIFTGDEDDGGASGEEEGRGRRRARDGSGEEAWRNHDGERLADFGVDEDVDFYDEEEEDVPLAELIRRRKPVRREP